MATYGGANIFGDDVRMKTEMAPAQSQRVAFFGLSGIVNLHGGDRGRTTVVRGTIVGASPFLRSQAIGTFESYRDGVARTLVDTDGVSWGNVLLEGFSEAGDRLYDATNNVYIVEYQATFIHCTMF